jgi:hypothetical protein
MPVLYKNFCATEAFLHAQREKSTVVRREVLYARTSKTGINTCLGH